jgi:Tol biopolymer transport system component
LHHMADARIEIQESLAGVSDRPVAAQQSSRSSLVVPTASFGAGALVASAVLLTWFASGSDIELSARPIPFAIDVGSGPDTLLTMGVAYRHVAISADGNRIAYVSSGDRVLMDGPTGSRDAREAAKGTHPFYSADGEWLAYEQQSSLWKISLDGGAPVRITDFEPRFLGGAWRDDTIVFAVSEGLFVVSDGGDSIPEPLLLPDDATLYAWPSFISGTSSLLFTMLPSAGIGTARLACLDLETREITQIGQGTGGQYLPDGYLVYAVGEGLEAIAFDPYTCETSGAPAAVSDVDIAINQQYAVAEFAVSESGTLITMSVTGSSPLIQPVWVDPATGAEQATGIPAGNIRMLEISSDGTRVALDRRVDGNRDVFVHDLRTGSMVNVSNDPTEDVWLAWGNEGERIYFGSRQTSDTWSQIYSRRADGLGPTELLIDDRDVRLPWSVSASGHVLVFNGVLARSNIGIVSNTDPREAQWLLDDPRYREENASLSPAEDFLLYESDESGRPEAYIRPWPEIGAFRFPVTTEGGNQPRWGPETDGHRIVYYRAPTGYMMEARLDLNGTRPEVVGRRELFRDSDYAGSGESGFVWEYDVAPNGLFLMLRLVESEQPREVSVNVIINWDTELARILGSR